ncbi:MFS transporter [Rickettsiella endosymbiont of Dermanyssus gallinae]|uniref:MFS transporter n=1 Tax=Rickettsiella endosymbiont of Dermanyssus gallinae TaxID=2856608 RepID=UPI001C52D615|nr:MFS transporter [Rickettsiella endosymbiont of Dermanyssus gallinae]
MSYSHTNSTSMLKSNLGLKGWIVCFVASLFFLFEFLQVNMFSSIDPEVMKAYGLDSTQLGFLSSIYFYSTVVFLLPAGYLLDRFSPKKIILVTLILSIIGIIGFALSYELWLAAVYRCIEGIASAFCFLGCFKISTNWVPKSRLALATGLIMTIAMLGGVLAQTPLMLLVETYGWRNALLIDAMVGAVVGIAILSVVKDSPDNKRYMPNLVETINYWHAFKNAASKVSNWSCGIYTCLMNLPMMLLGAIWGSLFLMQAHSFARADAATIVSMIFIGTIVGAPIAGWASDFLCKRKAVMWFAALLSLILTVFITYQPHLSKNAELLVFFLVGFISSAQILGYPTAAQNDRIGIPAMSASIVSFTTMSGYIVFMPLFGWVMNIAAPHTTINGVAIYTLFSYQNALWIISVGLFLAFVSVFFIRNPEFSPKSISFQYPVVNTGAKS